jgi:hypothetical protein
MTVLITLTTAGANTGPFDLYSDLDNYTIPFATGVPRTSLVAGYSSTVVPDDTTTIRLKSTGNCSSYVDIPCDVIFYSFSLYKGEDCPSACENFALVRSSDFFNLL